MDDRSASRKGCRTLDADDSKTPVDLWNTRRLAANHQRDNGTAAEYAHFSKDLWTKNTENASRNGITLTPEYFAEMFVDSNLRR